MAYNGAVFRAGLIAVLLFGITGTAVAGGDWNDRGIHWHDYDAGLRLAKAEKKPVCLVFYTTWCPHCVNYSRVFHDPQVVALAERFVMIRLDRDANRPISRRYDFDGEYIPRTFFLAPDGRIRRGIHATRQKFKHFFDENDPASLLLGMAAALEVTPKQRPSFPRKRP